MPISQCFHNPHAGKPQVDAEIEEEARLLIKDLSSPAEISAFHTSLGSFMPTPLIPHPELASTLGVSQVFIKCETSRLGLPAYKILGASYGIYRHLRRILDVPDNETTKLPDIARAAQKAKIRLCCATDGNHGRAVSHIANLLGIPATIFIPSFVPSHAITAIESEGRSVDITISSVSGPYLEAESQALKYSLAHPTHHLIQDNSIPELHDDSLVTWILAGYRTIFYELDTTLTLHNLSPSLIVVPVGVGSLAHAVSMHYNATKPRLKIMTVEPVVAASLFASLEAGSPAFIETGNTILTGLNCGTVSPLAFPILKRSVDFAATVEDWSAHEGVADLRRIGIDVGPIAGACISALKDLEIEKSGLNKDSVVVVIATEGRREYEVPLNPANLESEICML